MRYAHVHIHRPKGTQVNITSSAAVTQPYQRNEDGRGASPAGDTRDKLTITFLTRTPVEGEQWQPDDARKRAGVGLKLRSNMVSVAHIWWPFCATLLLNVAG